MEHFRGKLLDGERVLFGPVSGVFEEEDGRGVRSGHLEIHVDSAPMLVTSRPILAQPGDEDLFAPAIIQCETVGAAAGMMMLAFQAPGGVKPRGR